jgi:beta-galactosidase
MKSLLSAFSSKPWLRFTLVLEAGLFIFAVWTCPAQTLTDIGVTAPTPGAYDVVQISTNGNQTAPDGLNYYTDNQSNHGSGEPGQIFATRSDAGGYVLTSVAIRTCGLGSSTYSAINMAQPYYLHIYSITNSTATLLQTCTVTNFAFTDGDWLQWSGLSLPLAANTAYAYSFGKASSLSGWEPLAVATNNPYAGGEIGLISPATGAITTGGSHKFDAVFDIGLILATVPSVNAISVSPATNVYAGTTVTIAATVSGATPLSCQWQFNGGAGFANIIGATASSLVFTATTTNTGLYQLVLVNSYGATTSAPVSLVINLDTNPPVVLNAFNVGLTNVELDFSKTLETASATNPANYVFTNGLTIAGASLLSGGASVILVTAPLTYGSNYTIVINGVRDLAVPPNTIVPNTAVSFAVSPRQRILLDNGWRFQLGDPSDVTTNVTYYPEIPDLAKLQSTEVTGTNSETYYETNRVDIFATHAGENVSFVQTNCDDSSWRLLNLPHDWAVGLPFNSSADGGHGFKPVGSSSFGINNIGWYRHTFVLPAGFSGQNFWLEFGGVYRNCLVWLNGHILGRNVSGYSSFYFDVTPYLNPGGTNVLVVRVDASRFEGWFYEGAGIYRHVWLTTENPVHVAEWGTFAYTSTLSGSNATVTIRTDVTNQSNAATVNGNLISTIRDANGNAVASVASPLNIPAGQDLVVTQSVSFVANLWSLETPYLYKLVTIVSNQNAVADIYNTPFGVRTVSIDSTNGVFINGRHVEIQGMCNHQDMAGVGSALPDRLQYYRIERLKEMGCNAYRTSHNEPTAELIDACDQLGMLVLDENRRIGTNAEPLSELSRQIRRDRNHPSVFMWSLANEESLQGTSTGASIMQVMQNLVHSLDPSRLCTAALNSWGSGFSSVLDVNGFNYALGSLDSYHAGNPAEPIIGSETSSEVGTRGIYTNEAALGYVRAYDNNAVSWGETAEAWWQFYSARPWASGGFCWTGFDYRGEPTPYGWPCINSHFGVMDMCGFPKDIFYYYQANWSLKPVLHLFPHWNWSTPGQPIDIWAFGNCQTVELFTNGVSLGRQTLNVQSHVEWDNVPYSAGTLQAIGYNYGVPVITNTVVTAGAPAAIALIPDRSNILSDGRDVLVVTVAVLDSLGNVVPTATNEIYFAISGNGTILGVGDGNPSSHEADKANQRAVFNGLAQVIIQSTTQPGSITLTATSPGLNSTYVAITAASTLPPPDAPTNVAALAGNGQVAVSWDIVPGATTYNLWRATTSGGPYTLIAEGIGGVNLGYLDASVTNGTTYYYQVSANGNGTSPNSAEVSAAPMLIVTNISATATNGQILVNWIGSPGAAYNLKRSYVSGGPYATIASSLAGTNFTDADVASCQSYYYVVTITNAGSESPDSPEAVAEVGGSLPPQFTHADIGAVGLAGSAWFCDGQFAISGSGADIWGAADAFQFVYTYVPVSTNCDIRARIASVDSTSSNAKAAVMIRESLATNSSFVMVDVEPSAGIEFIWRNGTGSSAAASIVTGETAPNWVRLTRTNNTFTAYWSPDGVSWNQIGSPTNLTMVTSDYVGLVVCAHNNSALNTSLIDNLTASFLTNVPPVINWVAPTNNQAVYRAGTIYLTASATDADGSVTNVSFFNGSSPMGTSTVGYANQFSLAWSNAAAGNYNLTAVATDNSGATNTIPATILISVVQPPLVVLKTTSGQPVDGQFSLNFQGLANQSYVLFISTNLINWTAVQTNNTTADGAVTFTDLAATNMVGFYRTEQQ